MLAAIDNAVPGIDADCGGQCVCATCHVYVDEHWSERLVPASQTEQWTLDGSVDLDPARSRLACQIVLTEALDGLTVTLPQSQR